MNRLSNQSKKQIHDLSTILESVYRSNCSFYEFVVYIVPSEKKTVNVIQYSQCCGALCVWTSWLSEWLTSSRVGNCTRSLYLKCHKRSSWLCFTDTQTGRQTEYQMLKQNLASLDQIVYVCVIVPAMERLQRELLVKYPVNDAQEWSDNVWATKGTMASFVLTLVSSSILWLYAFSVSHE